MDNTFNIALDTVNNYKRTENGAVAVKSTFSGLYDLFALGGAYRGRTDQEMIDLFYHAFEEDIELAIKCLFYLRDCRGGQGERHFFRVCFSWLADRYPDIADDLLTYIPRYGRWDDLIYSCLGTKLEILAFCMIENQLHLDLFCDTPSLMGKWLPSENASSKETKAAARKLRKFLCLTPRKYRKALTALRAKINIVEALMSQNRWDEIEFDKIPAKASFIYRNAFAVNEITSAKYRAFMMDRHSKVNAATLYPYEIVKKANLCSSVVEMYALEKYWKNLPNYFEGKENNSMMCVVDTSASMTWHNGTIKPIDVAISIGMYCAERAKGPFENRYISFSSKPQLVKVKGLNFVDKVRKIYRSNICEDTNLAAVFDLLKNTIITHNVRKEDIPKTLIIISDMEINEMDYKDDHMLTMEKIRKEWAAAGLTLPRLVYWNVAAREDTILDTDFNVSLVSGLSPVIFKTVLSGKSGFELMLETLNSERYKDITIN